MRSALVTLWLVVACSPGARRPEAAVIVPIGPEDAGSTSKTTPPDASPSDASSEPPPRAPERHASVYPVFHFAPNATALPEGARDAIRLVAGAMSADAGARVVVTGSAEKTEAKGTALARARAVAAALVQAGVAGDRVSAAERQSPGPRSVEIFDAAGDRFSVLYVQWHGCCATGPVYDAPSAGSQVGATAPVTYVVDAMRPDTPEGRAAQAEQERACAACNGDWGIHGMFPIPGCLCRTRDAHKPCSSPRDCQGSCEISWEDAMRYHGAAQLPAGACSEFFSAFGCHGWIVETDAGRDTKWICRD